jgi:putative endonuclease
MSKNLGDAFELHAVRYLTRRGLTPVARNVRYRGGEIDLIMRAADGTIVFVEVRARSRADYGGALASVGARKRARLILAARLFLVAQAVRAPRRTLPPCRFDIVAFDGGRLTWVVDAFGDDSRLR